MDFKDPLTLQPEPLQLLTQDFAPTIVELSEHDHYHAFVLFCFVLVWFRDRVSLFNCSGCPGTLDQTGLELTDPPASASL